MSPKNAECIHKMEENFNFWLSINYHSIIIIQYRCFNEGGFISLLNQVGHDFNEAISNDTCI